MIQMILRLIGLRAISFNTLIPLLSECRALLFCSSSNFSISLVFAILNHVHIVIFKAQSQLNSISIFAIEERLATMLAVVKLKIHNSIQFGGSCRSRTGVNEFAIQCMATLLTSLCSCLRNFHNCSLLLPIRYLHLSIPDFLDFTCRIVS